MFWCTVVALVLLFTGSTFLDRWLREHPFLFVGFWGVCLWFTSLVVLLAFFDLLLVRASGRRARRKLEREYFHEKKERDSTDENAH